MIGIVIAAHGHLAEELVETARQIVGELPSVATCSVDPSAAPESYQAQVKTAVKSVDQGQGVIVFADLVGGSPCTQSLSLCQQANLEVVTGVNLPMLIKANTLRLAAAGTLQELAAQLVSYGQRTITCATEKFRARIAG